MSWTIDRNYVIECLDTVVTCYLIGSDLQLAMLANAWEDVGNSFSHYVMIMYSHYYIWFCITRSSSPHALHAMLNLSKDCEHLRN